MGRADRVAVSHQSDASSGGRVLIQWKDSDTALSICIPSLSINKAVPKTSVLLLHAEGRGETSATSRGDKATSEEIKKLFPLTHP